MKRKVSAFILIFICFFTVCSSLMAAAPRVNDLANLLSLDQMEELENKLSVLSETYQMEVVIVTTNDAQGKTAITYADDFYDTHGYGYGDNWDGLLFLIDMDNRELAISTCGLGAKYLNDTRINNLMDTIAPYLTAANYYEGCNAFINGTQNYFKSGIPSNDYLDFEDKKPFTNSYGNPLTIKNYFIYAGIALLVALIVASITRVIISYRYKHPHHTVPATLPDQLSVNYTEKHDQFISTHTIRTKIETPNSNGGGSRGGGSSMHGSSSGRSHGGGSRGF